MNQGNISDVETWGIYCFVFLNLMPTTRLEQIVAGGSLLLPLSRIIYEVL